MSRPWWGPTRRGWWVALLLPLLVACGGLPESGPVQIEKGQSGQRQSQTSLFIPPGPGQGDTPSEIVSGFLLAMQANPLSTSVARSFLSSSAQATWNPDQATLIYNAQTVDSVTGTGAGVAAVRMRLGGVDQLDSRGGWLGSVPAAQTDFLLHLVREHGQWRISDPPNTLLEPTEYFAAGFSPYNLYFFDQTERALVPDRVYLPRGPEVASSLVRSLLVGPGQDVAAVTRTEFPPQTELDLSVLLGGSGLVNVPLSAPMLRISPDRLTRAVQQLAATLAQLPGFDRLSVSVGDIPVSLPDGRRSVPLSPGAYSGLVRAVPTIYGLQQSRVVALTQAGPRPVPGALGRPGYSLRSVGVSLDGTRAAVVATDGGTVFAAPIAASRGAVQRVYQGTNVLKPAFDMFDETWLIDDVPSGAKLVQVTGQQTRTLSAPGITGRPVEAFTVSRDGTRLVAAVGGPPRTAGVWVSQIARTADGSVSTILPATRIAGPARVDGIRGLTWSDPGDLAVLTVGSRGLASVSSVPIDGSPGDPQAVLPDPFRGPATGLLGGQDSQLPIYLAGPHAGLVLLDRVDGRWLATTRGAGLAALTYPG